MPNGKRVVTPDEVFDALHADGKKNRSYPRSKAEIEQLMVKHLGIDVDYKREDTRRGYGYERMSPVKQMAETVVIASISKAIATLVEEGRIKSLNIADAKAVGLRYHAMRERGTYYLTTDIYDAECAEAQRLQRNDRRKVLKQAAEQEVLMKYDTEVWGNYLFACETESLDPDFEAQPKETNGES